MLVALRGWLLRRCVGGVQVFFEDFSRKIKFFDENVVFVLDGYGRYYYTYDQMAQVTQGKSFTYWAYNLEQAIDLGYRAWK